MEGHTLDHLSYRKGLKSKDTNKLNWAQWRGIPFLLFWQDALKWSNTAHFWKVQA